MYTYQKIVERQLIKQRLVERIDSALWDEALTKKRDTDTSYSGQDSERFLVMAIQKLAVGKTVSLGDLGSYEIVGAKSIAGVNPEPKADIIIECANGLSFGISMKKGNFEFLENWMDEEKLRTRLQQVGMTQEEADLVTQKLQTQARLSTEQLAETITAEKEAFVRRVQEKLPGYQYPARISKEIMNSLAEYEEFRNGPGNFSVGKFNISNYYVKLSGLFGERYGEFLRLIVSGGEENARKADGVLVADVHGSIGSLSELQVVLDNIKAIDTVVKEYKADPKVNIAFRLRPITLTRTTYSRTNANKYRVGKRFYENEALGVSWTVSVVSVGAKAEKDDEE